MAQTVKNLPTMLEPWVRSLGQEDRLEKGNGYPLQYSCLENTTGWEARVHGITKSQAEL